MWKNIIKLQKFYPHEYWFSNVIAFSSVRPSRGSSEIFLQRQKHSIILPKIVRTGWGFNLSPAVWGSNLSPNQLFEWLWKSIFFLDIIFIFFSNFFYLSIQRRSFDWAGLLYHPSSSLGPGRLPKTLTCYGVRQLGNRRPRDPGGDALGASQRGCEAITLLSAGLVPSEFQYVWVGMVFLTSVTSRDINSDVGMMPWKSVCFDENQYWSITEPLSAWSCCWLTLGLKR